MVLAGDGMGNTVPVDAFEDVSAYCGVVVPDSQLLPIAVIGAGAIADVGHLPAYARAGLPVIGVHDVDVVKASAFAKKHSLSRVYETLDDLLGDENVTVVDIAVPGHAQPELVRAALAAGKHVLAQKPFAPTVAIATELAQLAAASNRILAVNQQLRFEETVAAAHRMVELGWVGALTAVTFSINIWTDWTAWPWMVEATQLEVWNHSIHYHDAVRWFLGEPETLFSVGGRTPGQAVRGETRTVTTASYQGGAVSVVQSHHHNRTGDNRAEFRIEGSTGAIRGTLGLLYDYPRGRLGELEVSSPVIAGGEWTAYPVTHWWIPDAFVGPMASVLAAAATGSTALRSSAQDNVGTIAVVEAIYRSMATGQSQRLDSVGAGSG